MPDLALRPGRSIALPLLLFWCLAVVLALTGLGGAHLRDWDEGIVARVALELSGAPWRDKLWPTYWGDAYLNKPPGLHLLIAGLIGLWRLVSAAPAEALPPDALLRSLPALLSSLLVPLVGMVQWRLRPGDRLSALASAAVVLTLLPLARHGRLVMLDGSLLVAMVLVWWALLSAAPRPGRRAGLALVGWGLLAGLAGSALLLLKAPAALPLLLGPWLLRCRDRDLGAVQLSLLGLGLLLGLLPGLGWHLGHLLVRGPEALVMWHGQGFARLADRLEGHTGGPLLPLLEVLKGGWPWLPLWPFGLALAWRRRRSRWGRWCLGLTLLSAVVVLPLRTQLPWYSLLLWPAFALVCGPALAWLVERRRPLPPAAAWLQRLPWLWSALGAALLLAGGVVALDLVPLPPAAALLAVPLGAGLLLGGVLVEAPQAPLRRAGALLTVLGAWLSLLLLMASPLWLWELNESWSTAKAADLLRRHSGPVVFLWQEAERPSLNWYAGRRVRAEANPADVQRRAAEGVDLLSREQPEIDGLRCDPLERMPAIGLYHCQRLA
jgi:4-amino-4-deoxy-L-arabinose transferase-like glycosyltransferase